MQNYLNTFIKTTQREFSSTRFAGRATEALYTNLIPAPNFFDILEKRVLRILTIIRYRTKTTPWHVTTLVRFFEFCTGRRVFLKIYSFIASCLSFEEKTQCLIWSYRVKNYRKLLGTSLFLNESLQLIYLSLKLKDPFILSDWITKLFKKISFWKSRTLMRYLRYVLRHFFAGAFAALDVRGIKMQLSGKISVAGNARTRTVRHKTGATSHSTLDNKILTTLSLIPSFTGIQGFKIWLVF